MWCEIFWCAQSVTKSHLKKRVENLRRSKKFLEDWSKIWGRWTWKIQNQQNKIFHSTQRRRNSKFTFPLNFDWILTALCQCVSLELSILRRKDIFRFLIITWDFRQQANESEGIKGEQTTKERQKKENKKKKVLFSFFVWISATFRWWFWKIKDIEMRPWIIDWIPNFKCTKPSVVFIMDDFVFKVESIYNSFHVECARNMWTVSINRVCHVCAPYISPNISLSTWVKSTEKFLRSIVVLFLFTSCEFE